MSSIKKESIQVKLKELVKIAGNTDMARELEADILEAMSKNSFVTKQIALSELNRDSGVFLLYQAAKKANYMLGELMENYFDKYDVENEKDKTLYIAYDFNKGKIMADIASDYVYQCTDILKSWEQIANE